MLCPVQRDTVTLVTRRAGGAAGSHRRGPAARRGTVAPTQCSSFTARQEILLTGVFSCEARRTGLNLSPIFF
ncbi:hypothetical protein E2C01_066166 [Portunus trituberculatus]|uniref:Uncharacterized protein n=1 Tax=Portunus trituberculatus TaxID=210409 RepID=A0A5B7HRK3_PORTR|nr:hypothetical protein [Portunus trituberculatus]